MAEEYSTHFKVQRLDSPPSLPVPSTAPQFQRPTSNTPALEPGFLDPREFLRPSKQPQPSASPPTPRTHWWKKTPGQDLDPWEWNLPRDPNEFLHMLGMLAPTVDRLNDMNGYYRLLKLDKFSAAALVYAAIAEVHGETMVIRFQAQRALEPQKNPGVLFQGLVAGSRREAEIEAGLAAKKDAEVLVGGTAGWNLSSDS